MSDFLLTQIINYGAPILGGVVFLAALGIPFPATAIMIAVGAFSREGFLPWHTTGLVALTCVVLGDCLGYSLGYYVRGPVLRRFGDSERWIKAESFFQNSAGWSIFLTRFLVTGIASPVNVIAGTSNISFRKFFLFDFAGESVWVLGYGGLGYLFGSQWELANEFISNFGGLTLGLVLLGVGIWLGIRRLRFVEEAKKKVPESS